MCIVKIEEIGYVNVPRVGNVICFFLVGMMMMKLFRP